MSRLTLETFNMLEAKRKAEIPLEPNSDAYDVLRPQLLDYAEWAVDEQNWDAFHWVQAEVTRLDKIYPDPL